jgi:hypothetical protein
MQINKNTSLTPLGHVILTSLIVITVIIFLASCGGGGSSGSTDDTNDDTTGYTYLPYDPATVPAVTSFSDTAYDLSDAATITLNGTSITVSGTGATVSGSIVTITAAGTYNVTGTLSNGQLKVDTSDPADVRLYLNGVNITSSTASPVDIENATRVIVVLPNGKDNYLTDGTSNTSVDGDGDAVDAALYSKDDLVIYGGGSLTVDGNYKDGIKCKDGLIIDSGTINVTSTDDGIIGKNYVSIEDGTISISAGGDGLKSTNDGTDTQGYIVVGNGIISITAGADGIQAQTHVVVKDGEFTIDTNGGSANPIPATDTTTTAKGLKSSVGITIDGGSFDLDTSDDALHSSDTIIINGGEFHLASGDDAMHSELALTINNGVIDVSKCYEGIESAIITINDGNIHVIASNDPINASDGSGAGMPVQGGGIAPVSTDVMLYINGGYISLQNAANTTDSDGFDSNGSIEMTGGIVIINGGVGMNGIMDYNTFKVTGGFIIGAGTSGMPQAAGDSTSTQNSFFITLNGAAGTLFHVQRSDGVNVATFAPSIAFQAIEFSSPLLKPDDTGYTYSVYTGGSYSPNSPTDGLYGAITGNVYEDNGTYDASSALLVSSGHLSTYSTPAGGGPGGGGGMFP